MKYIRKISSILMILFSNSKAAVGFIVLLVFILIALLGPLFFTYDGMTQGSEQFLSPSSAHWLGTDYLGRDVLQMLINGTGDVLSIAFMTGLFTVIIGTVLGIISGYIGGWFDKIMQMITNLFLTIPSFPILMVLATIITITNNVMFSLILSLWSWAGLCRAVRAQVMSLKERDFIQICKVMNMSKTHIVIKELLPNMASYIIINFIMIMRGAITGSVGLMMLGVAAFEPSNWGAMIYDIMNQGTFYIESARAYLVSPIAFIVLFQFGIIMLSNGLDERLNPRLIRN